MNTLSMERAMHALRSLIKEHQVITQLIDCLERYADGLLDGRDPATEARDLYSFAHVFRGYADELHHEKEEEILQPFLTRHGFHWDDGVLADIRAEHERERYLIDVLEQAAECELEWTAEDRRSISATALALVTFQREHLAKENDELFPEAVRRLSAGALEDLRAALERFDRVPRHAALAVELVQLTGELLTRYPPPPSESGIIELAGAAEVLSKF
jgi:hemerythrin-like domain-containing protein